MAITLEELTDSVLVEVPEATEPTIERAIRFSAIEFFQRTRIWRQVLTVARTEGTRSSSVTLTGAGTIYGTEQVRFQRPTDSEPQRLDATTPELYCQKLGTPTMFYRTGLEFTTDGDAAGVLTVDVSVLPDARFTELPDDFLPHYEVIRSGALSRVLSMPSKPWTDPNAAVIYRAMYMEGIAQARDEAERSFDKPLRIVKYGGL